MSTPPQTGDAGSVNAQGLLQQVLASGSGGGGMQPPGSTGIVSLGTSGTTGPATYNPTTGNLNIPNYKQFPAGSTGISTFRAQGTFGPASYVSSSGLLTIPVYAWGTPNFQKSYLTANYSTSSTTPSAIGNGTGILFATNFNPYVVVSFIQLMSFSGTNVVPAITVIRGTQTVPPVAGTPIPAPDTPILETKMVNTTGGWTISGSVIDTAITVGVTYCYYLALWITTGTTPVATAQSGVTNSSFSVFELK